ncbi:patatin-like phospholipase family protein [Arthrobacter antibioticus]|uniref:patatin-like phospholipase family protein n=1 Tax=Arthrobacter sp. H35-MC1 TaxID=3046203 RepID=UPI0024BA5134|nr:patatin-like phospholipase family protein [Arthrobacter sp. H35-MC1]MDJ0317029.1 patatin-like phospholipase family protein [Arthrobacter sp. H35-MC1]
MADADLVLEGGGLKSSALVGAIAAMTSFSDPYSFHRIAGASAGAIVAGLLAAGLSAAQIKNAMDRLDYTKFMDPTGCLSGLPIVGEISGLLFHQGLYAGEVLYEWLKETLAAHGVHTWADLKDNDPQSALPASQRYKLVVIVSDISRGIMLRLPWDYRELLGVDPDTAPVADAIRASASIPFFFRPWTLSTDPSVTGHKNIVCSDGGLLSNFPMSIFDRDDGALPRWPTIGIKLSDTNTARTQDWNPEHNSLELAKSLLSTIIGAADRSYVNEPQASSRTIFINTSNYRATDFNLTQQDKDAMYASGLASGERFLARWDFKKWQSGDYSM